MSIRTQPNQRPWRNRGVSVLLKACDEAYKADDTVAVRAARNKLKAGITPKNNYRLKIENVYDNPECTRQGILSRQMPPLACLDQ